MKQKTFSILLTLLMCVVANVTLAYDAEIDGIYYNFSGTEATVTFGDNKYTGDIVIPETITYDETVYSVVAIGGDAFWNCYSRLTSITIPNSVTSIGEYAFENCSGLTSVTIPNSVTTIGYGSFQGCSGLTEIVVEEGNTIYDSRNNCNALIETSSNTLIAGCMNTTIPNNVTSIGSGAFYDCYDLNSITIPKTVISIGNGAFYGCINLTSVKIPGSVTSIGDRAFSGCGGLTVIAVEEENTNYDSRNNCNAIIETSSNTLITGCKNTTIPNSVISIGDYAFTDCNDLITIPGSVMNIGYHAFACKGLTAFTVDDDNVSFASEDGVLFNKAKTVLLQYPMAKNETTYAIPSSVKRIEGDSFLGCSGLSSITIPNSVTSIGYYAFGGCFGLTSIMIPNSVTSIESYAFGYCNSLTSVTIPNSVTCIEDVVFFGCSSLTSVTIPSSVTSIGDRAFGDCNSLIDLYCYTKNVPTTHPDAYAYTPISNITLHVPIASIEAYKMTEPWSGFKEIVVCNDVDVENQSIKAGNSTSMDIDVSNYDTNLVGFQMDLTLPEGVGIDKTGCTLSDRITDENQKLTIGKLESGAYRITSTSLSLKPISGNDGTLLSLKLTAEDGCIGGQATISNIIFSTSESEKVVMSDKTFDISILYNLTYKVDGEEYKTSNVAYGTTIIPEAEPTKEGYTFGGWSEIPETMPNHDVEITGRFYLYGDVNTDEEVDVVDVVDIARFVVATPSVKFREKLADLNFDKTVNIADAVTLVNFIAGDQNFSRMMTSSRESYDYDLCQLQLLSNGSNALSLCLDGAADFTAFQFEMELPENTDITAMRVNGQRMGNHKLLYNKVEANRYRVAVLSFSNAVFKGNAGELLNISIDGLNTNEISVYDIHFVTKNGTDITFDALALSGTVTGIANVSSNESDNVIFDLQGRKLSKTQRGVNIINGKKVIVNK